jgi:hypothetical protein
MERDETRLAIAAYVRDRLFRECSARRGVAADIARATGATTAHIANVKNGKATTGDEFARKVARYWNLTYPQLEAAAAEWYRTHSPPPPSGTASRWVEIDPRYPNLAEALHILRREGEIDAGLLDDVERTQLKSDHDLPTTVWIKMIEVEAMMRRRTPIPVALPVRHLSHAGQVVAEQMRAARRRAGLGADEDADDSAPGGSREGIDRDARRSS